jgi:hypothetical protein
MRSQCTAHHPMHEARRLCTYWPFMVYIKALTLDYEGCEESE